MDDLLFFIFILYFMTITEASIGYAHSSTNLLDIAEEIISDSSTTATNNNNNNSNGNSFKIAGGTSGNWYT